MLGLVTAWVFCAVERQAKFKESGEVDSILNFVCFAAGTTTARVLPLHSHFRLRADQHDDAEHEGHVPEQYDVEYDTLH